MVLAVTGPSHEIHQCDTIIERVDRKQNFRIEKELLELLVPVLDDYASRKLYLYNEKNSLAHKKAAK